MEVMNTVLEIIFWFFILVIFYTYIGYGIVLYIAVKVKNAFCKETTPANDFELPEMTLLFAAYNEEDVVDAKMENTFSLKYPKDKLKIYWVTDGSNDSTNEKLSMYGDRVTILFQPERQGKSAAINRAIPFIKTPITVFSDANSMLNEDALMEIARCFTDNLVGGVSGEKRIVQNQENDAASGGEGAYWKYESFLKRYDARLKTVVGAAGELFAIRTPLYDEIEADALLDDFMLSLRIAAKGYKIDYCQKAYSMETSSMNMQEEQKRKIRISAGGLQSIARLKDLLNPFKYGCLTFQYISHRVLRWTITPLFLFLLIPVNLLLACSSVFYFIFFLLQCLFYLMAFAGYVQSRRSIKSKLFFIPYYFTFMNVCVFKGIHYLKGRKGKGVWEKATRAK